MCLAQGIVGSVPWTALVFLTLYLQLLGMTDFAASVLMAVFLGSTGRWLHMQYSAVWVFEPLHTDALCMLQPWEDYWEATSVTLQQHATHTMAGSLPHSSVCSLAYPSPCSSSRCGAQPTFQTF